MTIFTLAISFAGVSISITEVSAATKKQKKITKEYKKFIKKKKYKKHIKEWNRYFGNSGMEGLSYAIADIDNNKIPELLIQATGKLDKDWACTAIYTYDWKKKKIKRVVAGETFDGKKDYIFWSLYGITSYSPKYKAFLQQTERGFVSYTTIKKNMAKSKHMLWRDWDPVKESYTYYDKNKKISEKKFLKYGKSLKRIKYVRIK